jgi:hypothetical protein
MFNLTTTPPSGASHTKAALVTVGLEALSRGDLKVVMAVTALVQKRGLSHE